MSSRSLLLENAKGKNESESTRTHAPRGSSVSRMKRVHYLRTNSAFDAGALARSTDSLDVKTEIVNTSTGLIKSTTLVPKKSALSIQHLSSEDRPLPNRAPSATSGVSSSSLSFSSFQTAQRTPSSLSKKSPALCRKNVVASRFITPLPPQRVPSLSRRSVDAEQRTAIATLNCFESTLTFFDPQDISGSNFTPSLAKHEEAAITTELCSQSSEFLAATLEHKNSITELSTSPDGEARESSSSSDGRPSLTNSQNDSSAVKPNSLSSESDEEESDLRKREDTRRSKSVKSKRKNTSAPNNTSKCVNHQSSSKNETLTTGIHQIARPSVYVHRFKCDYCNKLMSVKIDLSQQGNSKALFDDQRRTITARELSVLKKMSSEAALEVHHRSGKCPLVPLRCELPDSEVLFTANRQMNRESATCGVICRGESMMRYHQENSCLNRLVPCPNSKRGCSEMVSIGSLSLHLKRCLSDLVACPDCSSANAGTHDTQSNSPYYHRSEIELHRLTCPNVLIPCPFKGCSFCAIYPGQKEEVTRMTLPISTPIHHILLQCGSVVGLDSYQDHVSKLNAVADFLRIEPCEIQGAERVQLKSSPQPNNSDGHKREQPNETNPVMYPLSPSYTPANLPPLTSARIRSITEVAEALSGSSSAFAVFEGLEQLLLSPDIADKAAREIEKGNKNTQVEAYISRGLVRRSDVPAHHEKLFGFASQTLEQMIDQIFNLLLYGPNSSDFPTREALTLLDLFQLLIASELEAHTHSGSATPAHFVAALELMSSTIFAMFAAGIGVYERENISLEPVATCPVDLKVCAMSSASDHDKATILSFSCALRNSCEKLISVRVCRLANSQLRRKVQALECSQAIRTAKDCLFELKKQETSFRCKIVSEEEHKRPNPSFLSQSDGFQQFFEVNDSTSNPLDSRLTDEARQTTNLSPNFAVDPYIHEPKFIHYSDDDGKFERLETQRSEIRSPDASIENLIQAEKRILEACAWIEDQDANGTHEGSRVRLVRPRTASIAQEYTRYLEKMVRSVLTGPRCSSGVPTPFSRDEHSQFSSQTLDGEDEFALKVTRNVESLWVSIRVPLLKLAWGIRVIEKFDAGPSMNESNTLGTKNH